MYSKDELHKFQAAVQSMKLYRRAELRDSQDRDLVEELYIDPLPNDHVLEVMLRPATTFLIGRKGTGKSTVFLRAQKAMQQRSDSICAYVDIKTVYESSGVDSLNAALRAGDTGTNLQTRNLLMMRSFLGAVVKGIKDDVEASLKSSSWIDRVRAAFSGRAEDLFESLNEFMEDMDSPEFVNVDDFRSVRVKRTKSHVESSDIGGSLTASVSPGASLGAEASASSSDDIQLEYQESVMRIIDIRGLIASLKEILVPAGVRHLYIFLDDFSELPREAMEVVVDTLISPLNNWSEELVKFKIAAYPSRIYYGKIDKSKVDEIDLDIFNLYGSESVTTMEEKASEFVERLITSRLKAVGLRFERFLPVDAVMGQYYRLLFYASLGNPRILGYLLIFLYRDQLIYGKPITASSIRSASRRYYEEKVEPYFEMVKFMQESFDERSSIFSLKELLESIVSRARGLKKKDAGGIFDKVEGQHPTSHFHVSPPYESLLSTLELNFFLTKYYSMKDRDGRIVTVYALNAGLCEKHSLAFGRPSGDRAFRLYYVERIFNFDPIIRSYLANNQEIVCDECDAVHDVEDLASLQRFRMLCPDCFRGRCRVVNVSRKYQSVLEEVRKESLLPPTEFGILQTLQTQGDGQYASDIAGELDVSYQLIGRRAKNLAEMDLIDRDKSEVGRREYRLTETARAIYFDDPVDQELDLGDGPMDG